MVDDVEDEGVAEAELVAVSEKLGRRHGSATRPEREDGTLASPYEFEPQQETTPAIESEHDAAPALDTDT